MEQGPGEVARVPLPVSFEGDVEVLDALEDDAVPAIQLLQACPLTHEHHSIVGRKVDERADCLCDQVGRDKSRKDGFELPAAENTILA